MNAETLSIKMKLDIGNILNDVKKIKTQMNGMAQSVKQSIPKISTESKKAKEALNGVTRASKDVERALDNIGDEAKESLSTVSKQSNKLAQVLTTVGLTTAAVKAGMKTDDVTDSANRTVDSMEKLEGVIGDIQSLSFTGLAGSLAMMFSNPKERVEELKAVLDGLKEEMAAFSPDTASTAEWKRYTEVVEQAANVTNKHTKAVKAAKIAAIAFKAALIALAGVLATVVAVVNTLRISELGAQVYNGAQRAGMSAQAYQEWAYVLQRAGIEADELTEVIKTLTEAQVDVINQDEEFINAFKRLGISAEEVKSMGQDALWDRTIAALQGVENVTDRTAIAYKIFGEDAAKLTTILNMSNAETQNLISTYNRLGGAMSKELIHNSSVLQGSLTNLKVAWQGLRNTLAQWVIPAVITVVNWLTKAIVVVNVFLQKFFNLDLTPAMDSISSGVTGATGAMSGYGDAIESATGAMEKLKRTQMGFDELNVVSNPNTSGGSSSGSGGGGGSGAYGDMSNLGSSIFTEASKQAEEFEKKVMDFMDKWGWAIKGIGIALAALTFHKQLGDFGTFIKLLREGNSLSSVLATTFPKLSTFISSIGTAAAGALGSIGALFGGGVAAGAWVLVGAITAIASVVVYLKRNWDEVTAAVKGFFAENIAPKLKEIQDNLKTLIPPVVLEALKKIWQGVKDIVAAFIEWAKSFEVLEFIGDLFEVVGEIIFNVCASVIGGAINSAVGFINGLVKAITGIKEIISGVVRAIVAVFRGDLPAAKTAIEGIFNGIKKYLSGWYDMSIGVIVNFVNGVGNWFSQLYPKFEVVWTKIKNLFSKIGTAIANGVTGAVKSAINSVLRVVTNKINTFIGWINGAVSLINKIPGVNIGTIQKLDVPQLATGGIVTSETIARIGERGKKEAVLPLEQNTGWMDTLADKIRSRGGSDRPIHVHVDVDGTELGWAVINSINNITKQTGGLQLAL